MATIKSYSDLQQSKKLAEILPIESADMVIWGKDLDAIVATDAQKFMNCLKDRKMNYIPCWSLAALLAFLPNSAFLKRGSVTELYRITLPIELVPFDWFVEPVDACVAMIEKLHKLKML